MEDKNALTVRQEHLLKRELLRMEINWESEKIDNMINMDLLGAPFVLPNGTHADGTEYPLFSYVLRHFVVSFPLLKPAKEGFWKDTAQPFIQGLASKDISSSADRDEVTKRRRFGRVIKRLLLLFFVAGMATNRKKVKDDKDDGGDGEAKPEDLENLAIDNGSSGDLAALKQPQPSPPPEPQPYAGPYAAIIGARETSISGFIRNKTHTEYIMECFMNGGSIPVYVVRSWAEFVQLNKQLTLSFPGKRMPRLPRKTLQNTTTVYKGSERLLLREPQRVTLRSYMNRLCQIPRVAHSDIFIDFMFRDQLELSPADRGDIEARLALDRQRIEDRKRFHELTKEREQRLDKYIGEIKHEILSGDVLPRLFLEMKTHRKVEDMSPLLQKFVEWCLVQLAGLLYDLLIANDSSPEFFSQIKRLHSLMPYTAMRGILKLSNPALILKKMTDLFMATPFGNKSLIQQMFIRILSDDMRSQEVLIAELEQRISSKDLIKNLEQYIAEDHYSRVALQQRATDDNIDLVMEIIRSYSPPARTKEVAKWHAKWQEAVSNEQASEDEDPLVEKFSQLKDLLKLKVRARDKEVLQEFWGDPLTIKFIRELVNVTYDVFIDVFKYAHVSESLGDFQKFMDDLVSYVEYATSEVVLDASQMVDNLLNLLKKHQNSIFKFINRIYAREAGFFVDMVEWMTLFVSFVKRGKEEKTKLDLLGLMEKSKAAVDQAKVREELDSLQLWLDKRRATAKAGFSVPKNEEFPVAGHFDVSDVGLSWDDVDFGLAEFEQDEIEEVIPEQWTDLSKDQITLERKRRMKLAEVESRKIQLAPRPELKETEKLLLEFKNMLIPVLSKATLEKTSIKDVEASVNAEKK